MLQLREENRLAQSSPRIVSMIARTPANGVALEEHANQVIEALRAERAAIAKKSGFVSRLGGWIDEALRTQAVEHLDEADYPQARKFAIAQGLHLLNWSTGSYRKFFDLLEPIIRGVNVCEQRPAHILELACGAGGFSMEISSIAPRKGLRVEVTGSDIVPLYVERANAKAAKDGNAARFRLADMLNLGDIGPDSNDIVFVAQSAHHFSPGQLARTISETSRICKKAFVSVDGYRSVPMLGFVVGTALFSLRPSAVHDAMISGRKFYGESELELIGRMGAPKAAISVGRIFPFNTTLTVRFDGARD